MRFLCLYFLLGCFCFLPSFCFLAELCERELDQDQDQDQDPLLTSNIEQIQEIHEHLGFFSFRIRILILVSYYPIYFFGLTKDSTKKRIPRKRIVCRRRWSFLTAQRRNLTGSNMLTILIEWSRFFDFDHLFDFIFYYFFLDNL